MPSVLEIAANFIEQQEGCRLKAYQDGGGLWTVGYGSTGPGITAGTEWTQAMCDERFQHDLEKFIHGVMTLVKVPLTNNQAAAITSFAYNVGLHNLERSGLLRFLNLEKYKDAADQFLLWNKIGMYISPGLTARRQRERALFLA